MVIDPVPRMPVVTSVLGKGRADASLVPLHSVLWRYGLGKSRLPWEPLLEFSCTALSVPRVGSGAPEAGFQDSSAPLLRSRSPHFLSLFVTSFILQSLGKPGSCLLCHCPRV